MNPGHELTLLESHQTTPEICFLYKSMNINKFNHFFEFFDILGAGLWPIAGWGCGFESQ
jgi:hypothetical protein